jgi:DNA polymerase III subunit delta'
MVADEDDLDSAEPEDAEPSAVAEIPAPRANAYLVGHEQAETALIEAHAAGKLPHALLIAGPRGIGKATLAFRLARYLLADSGGAAPGLFGPAKPSSLAIPEDHPVFRRVAAGGHADLLTVERERDPRRKERLRGEIVVEDTRAVAEFLRLTPAEGGWRIVIVDSADDMNRNAANALLKILEEPPRRSLLMLVSHAPGGLLPTIRSRCRRLGLKPLAEAEVVRLLARYRPDLSQAEARSLAALAEGSIGRALELAAAGGAGLYRKLLELLRDLSAVDAMALHGLADRLARADGESAYRTIVELLTGFLARMIRQAACQGRGEEGDETVPGERLVMRNLAARRSLDQWVEVWENLTRLFAQADELTLDRKQVVLDAFLGLEDAAR